MPGSGVGVIGTQGTLPRFNPSSTSVTLSSSLRSYIFTTAGNTDFKTRTTPQRFKLEQVSLVYVKVEAEISLNRIARIDGGMITVH